MNPLTQIKNTQKVTKLEVASGISDSASWHARFKHSAYVFAGGLDYGLTEGDLLAVFAQFGEIVDVDLVRDKDSGKSKGFAFVAYEDQRSTVLAVDNLSGASVAGRKMRVEHVDNYKKRKAELTGVPEEDDAADPAGDVGRGRSSMPHAEEYEDNRPHRQERGERAGDGPSPSGRGGGGGGGGDGGAAPWMQAGSMFSLLEEARQMEEAKKASKAAAKGAERGNGAVGPSSSGRGRDDARGQTGPGRGQAGDSQTYIHVAGGPEYDCAGDGRDRGRGPEVERDRNRGGDRDVSRTANKDRDADRGRGVDRYRGAGITAYGPSGSRERERGAGRSGDREQDRDRGSGDAGRARSRSRSPVRRR